MATPSADFTLNPEDLDNEIIIFFRNISGLLNNFIEFNKSQESQFAVMRNSALKIADALATRKAQFQTSLDKLNNCDLKSATETATPADKTNAYSDLIVNKPQTENSSFDELVNSEVHVIKSQIKSLNTAEEEGVSMDEEALSETQNVETAESMDYRNTPLISEDIQVNIVEVTNTEADETNLDKVGSDSGGKSLPNNETEIIKELSTDMDSDSDSCDFEKLERELEMMSMRKKSKSSRNSDKPETLQSIQVDFSTQTDFESDQNDDLPSDLAENFEQKSDLREKTVRNLGKTLTKVDTSSDCDFSSAEEDESGNRGIYTNVINDFNANLQSQMPCNPPIPYYINSQAEEDETENCNSSDPDQSSVKLLRCKVRRLVKQKEEGTKKDSEQEVSDNEVNLRKQNSDLGISDYNLSPDTSDEEGASSQRKKIDFLMSDDTLEGDCEKNCGVKKGINVISNSKILMISSDSSIGFSDSKENKKIDKKKRDKSSESSDSDIFDRKSKKKRLCSPTMTNDKNNEDYLNKKQLDESDVIEIENDSPLDTRFKLKKLICDENLEMNTQTALIREKERLKRLKQKREMLEKEGTSGLSPAKLQKTSVQQKTSDFYLDIDLNSYEKQVLVDPSLTKMLKPHQIEGVQFIWDSCFESVEMIKKNSQGGGCLLAHCMGLGKTFQLIALTHTLLANQKLTRVKRILILMPVNVEMNWKKEYKRWTCNCEYKIVVSRLNKTKQGAEPKIQNTDDLKQWFDYGGVFLISYSKFSRLLTPGKTNNIFYKYLLNPGPDLIIFDEGHVLKSKDSNLAQVLTNLRTLRRVVTTGTPLQNNLLEYHCMLNFVKPNLLGTLEEFKNRFVNPINNGQHKDSTDSDVRYMKKRAHVLHELLDGCVQRKDSELMQKLIPKKHEYVIKIRLSEKQIELYRSYLSDVGSARRSLIGDFQIFIKLTSHPWLVRYRIDSKRFVSGGNTQSKSGETDVNDDMEEIEFRENEKTLFDNTGIFWEKMVTPECEMSHEMSGKFMVFLKILEETIKNGEKLVLFSQSCITLDHIENLICKSKISFFNKPWKRNTEFFRIDGQVNAESRSFSIDAFNDPSNTEAKLFLITTRAGGVGINLCAANRCIIYDCGWNPTYENQAVSRIYRLGQMRECFVYRFVSQGCMEEKIYQRTVAKQALAHRVIDEHQIDRHFSLEEKQKLYEFNPDIWNESLSDQQTLLKLPKDTVLADILKNMRKFIVDYHEYETLFENRLDEELNEADRKSAWDEYEAEEESKKAPVAASSITSSDGFSAGASSGSEMNYDVSVQKLSYESSAIRRLNEPIGTSKGQDQASLKVLKNNPLQNFTNLKDKNNQVSAPPRSSIWLTERTCNSPNTVQLDEPAEFTHKNQKKLSLPIKLVTSATSLVESESCEKHKDIPLSIPKSHDHGGTSEIKATSNFNNRSDKIVLSVEDLNQRNLAVNLAADAVTVPLVINSQINPSNNFVCASGFQVPPKDSDYRLEKTLTGHNDNFRSVCFNNHGLLASGSQDNTIIIWRND